MTDYLELEIRLSHVEPCVWRTIQVPEASSFWDLHVAIQDAMGWQDCHLHIFRIRDDASGRMKLFGIPDEVWGDDLLPGWSTNITMYFEDIGDQIDYEYDFGDGWEHTVTLMARGRMESTGEYPRCVAGERACPPEDSGGPPGYERLQAVLGDRENPEHADILERIGGAFDPEAFECSNIKFSDATKRLKALRRS